MKFTVNRTELLAAAQNAERIAPRVSTIEILQCAYLQAEQDTLTVASGNLEIALEQQLLLRRKLPGMVATDISYAPTGYLDDARRPRFGCQPATLQSSH